MYNYRERERERDVYIYIYIYIGVYGTSAQAKDRETDINGVTVLLYTGVLVRPVKT